MARGVSQCGLRGVADRPTGAPLRDSAHRGRVVPTEGSHDACRAKGCGACCRAPQREEGMTRRGAGAVRPPEIDQSTAQFARPTKWTPAQASALLEVLDEIREWIWLSYGSQIQKELRRDRVTTTSAVPSTLGDEDVPF